jgi:glucose-6-phosphate isomerase
VDLCAHPPVAPRELTKRAAEIQAEGLDAVVLIGQGGSSQASMTITKLRETASRQSAATPTHDGHTAHDGYTAHDGHDGHTAHDGHDGHTAHATTPAPETPVAFRTMDSLSPVFVNHILGSSDPARTLYLVSSKSGSTIEPLLLERVAWRYVAGHLGERATPQRFCAITDPGSQLEHLARDKHYRMVLNSPPDVGGRFSALTVFALFPAALVGIDLEQVLARAAHIERDCQRDEATNPALALACFLYGSYEAARDKLSLLLPPSGQVFGLWVEQILAESLGKGGRGILPNVEVDSSILTQPHADRSVISYAVGEVAGFLESLEYLDSSIPALHVSLQDSEELFGHFIIWEYAVALLGVLLEINPFGQPDVELTKGIVRTLLTSASTASVPEVRISPALRAAFAESAAPAPAAAENAAPAPGSAQPAAPAPATAPAPAQPAAPAPAPADISLDAALRTLLSSLGPGDYFSLNAFLPFRGYGRREALERMRNRVASRLGAASCLEIGPRYLHSTGQLHKGGPNTGVFLILSADEENDIVIPGEAFTLGELATTQARADFEALASRGRRVVHVHLRDNDSETLSRFADRFCCAVSAIKR